MAAKMTQEEWAIQKGWGPDYIPSNEEMTEYQAYLDAPVQEVDASEQDLNLANKNPKPDDGNITKNSLSIAQQRMRGITNKPSYSDFEEMLGSYVNEDGNLSRRDRRNFRKKILSLGLIEDTNTCKNFLGKKPAKIYKFKKNIPDKEIF